MAVAESLRCPEIQACERARVAGRTAPRVVHTERPRPLQSNSSSFWGFAGRCSHIRRGCVWFFASALSAADASARRQKDGESIYASFVSPCFSFSFASPTRLRSRAKRYLSRDPQVQASRAYLRRPSTAGQVALWYGLPAAP